jgi:anti-sigma regulatory factor (Ser/Thr protein kinase)
VLTELSLSLSPVPTASRLARSGARDRFAGVLGRNTMADLELVVSELVTNAFDHGRGTIHLALAHEGDELHGSVTDAGQGFAYENRTVADHERRGRGLWIVDALVTRWGIDQASAHVWFHMSPTGG